LVVSLRPHMYDKLYKCKVNECILVVASL
jgi:hypothetical protein